MHVVHHFLIFSAVTRGSKISVSGKGKWGDGEKGTILKKNIPGNIPGDVEWGVEQPHLVKGGPAYCSGVETM